jgi:sensor histidine kinase YesM
LFKFIQQSTCLTKHDLIFSSLPRHRITRHVAIWTVWCVAYLLFFHYPIRSFVGWSLSNMTSANVQKIGAVHFVLKTLLFNTLLAVVIPQAAFIYALLYWLLPNYYYKRRNRLITACVTLGLLLIYYTIAAVFKIFVPVGNYVFGISKKVELGDTILYIYGATIDLLTSLPIVMGFALMIKLMKRWWLKQKETEQLAYEKTNAELQLLKAQVHPHFLFNTLNNIYFFALNASPKAPEMIKKLSGLLHYILNECNQPLVPLQKEIAMIRDYTALEKIRYGEQMEMEMDIQEEGSEKLIAPCC